MPEHAPLTPTAHAPDRHPAAAPTRLLVALGLMGLTGLLAGCEIPGLNGDQMSEADAKATGSACRHALRGIEDCYGLNPKAPRAAVYAGWKDMDSYMRENKIEGMPPSSAKGNAAKGEEIIEDSEPPKKAKKSTSG